MCGFKSRWQCSVMHEWRRREAVILSVFPSHGFLDLIPLSCTAFLNIVVKVSVVVVVVVLSDCISSTLSSITISLFLTLDMVY